MREKRFPEGKGLPIDVPDRLRFQVGVEGEVDGGVDAGIASMAWCSVSVTACLPTKAPAYVVFDAQAGRLYGKISTR